MYINKYYTIILKYMCKLNKIYALMNYSILILIIILNYNQNI